MPDALEVNKNGKQEDQQLQSLHIPFAVTLLDFCGHFVKVQLKSQGSHL